MAYFYRVCRNEKEIAEKFGYTKSSFSQIVNGKVPLAEKFIKKLCTADENINEVWVSTGEGNMLKNSVQTGDISKSTIVGGNVHGNGNKITHYSSEYDVCKKEVEHLKEIIVEKEKIITEKERLINLLLKDKG